MVILIDQPGQLCNRLFMFSRYLAHAIECDYALFYYHLDEYCSYFSSTLHNDFPHKRIKTRFSFSNVANQYFINCLDYLIYGVTKYHLNPHSKKIVQNFGMHYISSDQELEENNYLALAKTRMLFIKGWDFDNFHESFVRKADTLRAIFTPKRVYRDSVDAIISHCRRHCDVLVGVHLRRGDYRNYRQGIYYYEDTVYRKKMENLASVFSNQGLRPGFLLCSNEAIVSETFSGLNVFVSDATFIEDLYALAACDYIIGPPSTFSMWASFYGKTPHRFILSTEDTIGLGEFSPFIAQNCYEDGRIFEHG